MNLLALDTASDACSVALQCGEAVHERHEIAPRAHTKLLLPMIREVLAAAGLDTDELDAVALGNGPGSFIGVRIAASVAQGICHAAGLKLVPVSSMSAVAAEVIASTDATAVAVAQDARMDEVYLGLYKAGGDGLASPVRPECLQSSNATCVPVDGARWTAAGAGWRRYPSLLERNRDRLHEVAGVQYPRARFLLPTAGRALEAGEAIEPDRLTPFYIRSKVAAPKRGI